MAFECDEKSIHAGHRQRMRSKLLLHGARIFDTYELLEMLLYYVIPYKDTNPTAKLLLKRFSSLSGVLAARADELVEVSGVGERAAQYISTLGELFDSVGGELPCESGELLDSYDKVGEYLTRHFAEDTERRVVIMLLDNSLHLIATETLYRGIDYDNSGVKPEAFVAAVTRHKAAIAVTAHNHVFGPCYPTAGDRATNDLISRALFAVGAKYLEHYIVTGNQYIGISRINISGLVGRSLSDPFSSVENRSDEASVNGVFYRHSKRTRDLLCELISPLVNDQRAVDALLKKYGTVTKLLSLDPYMLANEVGEAAALAIKLYAYVYSRSVTDGVELGRVLNRAEVVKYLRGLYLGASVETVYAVMLDSCGRAVSCEYVSEGTVNTSEILPRKIINLAMGAKASAVIIAHNHPLGIAEPSDDDLQLTFNLSAALSLAGIRLEYHVIVAENSVYIIDGHEQCADR